MHRRTGLTVLYGLVNALAYCCLLPLWEGFDEGFHYGYVQLLSTTFRFPVADQANLTREIWRSYELTPVSHYLQPLTKAPINFGDYFAFSAGERERLRQELRAIPESERLQQQPGKSNYEVTQTPLPYIFMAAIDRALEGRPLPSRVLWLRIVCSLVTVLMLAHGTILLAKELRLGEPYIVAVLFCVFSTPMLYAVLSHICNDSFAVPVLCYLLWAAIRAVRSGLTRDWLIAGLLTAVALLTKAYLLFVVPVPIAMLGWALWRRLTKLVGAAAFCGALLVVAGPWYIRNLWLYRNLSGTVETTSNLNLGAFWKAALSLPWWQSIVYTAHSSLWTGNNSFTTFSSATLNCILVLLAVGALVYFARARRQIAEWTLVSAIALFVCGLAFIAVAFYISSKGEVIAPMPWYAQVLVAPVLLIVFTGLSRVQKPWGRIGRALFVGGWAYLMIATYFIKLLPLYGGFQGKATVATLSRWYLENGALSNEILGHTCLASASVLWTLAGVAGVLAVIQAGRLILVAD